MGVSGIARAVAAGSHEVVLGLLLSFKAFLITRFITVVSTHDVIDHRVVVVHLVRGLASAALQCGLSLLLVRAVSGLFLFFGEFFLLDRKVINDLLNLLGVAVLGEVLAQLAEEVFNAVGR